MEEKIITPEKDLGNGLNLNYLHLDALTEIGNFAAAHAATSLSKMVRDDIMIDLSNSHILKIEELSNFAKNPEERYAVVYLDIMDGTGLTLLVFPYEKALWLSAMFQKKEYTPGKDMDKMDESALCEIGNICIWTYLNAISKFMGVLMVPSPPSLAVDMLGAILDYPASLLGERAEYAVLIETNFLYRDDRSSGLILFAPDEDTQKLMYEKFGLDAPDSEVE